MFGIVMATNRAFARYAKSAVSSVRKYNQTVPVRIYLCGEIPEIEDAASELSCTIKHVDFPADLVDRVSTTKGGLIWTRIAKLTSMSETVFDPCLFLDVDLVALDDMAQITGFDLKCPASKDAIYMLLRRPGLPTVYNSRQLYLTDAKNTTQEGMTQLINETFGLSYSMDNFLALRCWNSGVIYGSRYTLNLFAQRALELYQRMVTGPHGERFRFRDQLCVWLAEDQLKSSITAFELPLEWNFMPGHAVPMASSVFTYDYTSVMDSVEAVCEHVKVLHFGDRKKFPWAIKLRESFLEPVLKSEVKSWME